MSIMFDDLHKKDRALIQSSAVSALSYWEDSVWRFPVETAGHGHVQMNWDVEMDDEQSLVDPDWSPLLDDAKRLYFSVLYHNKRKQLKLLSIGGFSSAFKYLLSWMSIQANNCPTFSTITPEKAEQFVKTVVRHKGGDNPDLAITTDSIAVYVNMLIRLFEQGATVREFPSAVVPEHPFNGRSAFAVAKVQYRKNSQRIPPVPEDLFLPVMTTATRWLNGPAFELMAAVKEYSARMGHEITEPGPRETALDRTPAPFTPDDDRAIAMPRIDGFRIEWHTIKRRLIGQRPGMTMRNLMADLTGACLVVLQGLVGMRVNELCSLAAYPRHENGLPYCVVVRPSLSGREEIFVIRGTLHKTVEAPTEVEWVAGSRPVGSNHIPLPVQAALTLQAIYLPWIGPNSSQLIKWIGRQGGDLSPQALTIAQVSKLQNRFIDKYVDVLPEYKKYRISTHQWRKSFALHIIRSDERLLAALADHFKHLSIVMTEQAYVGTDIGLLGLLKDTLLMDAVQMLEGIVLGGQRYAGKMVEIIEANMESIKAALPDGPPEKVREELKFLLEDENFRMFGAEWGGCFFRPETARCHHELTGHFDLSARRPCYQTRRADLCCSCSNLLISTKHLKFWRERHATNVAVYKENLEAGNKVVADVAKSRADNSAAVLRRLSKLLNVEEDENASIH